MCPSSPDGKHDYVQQEDRQGVWLECVHCHATAGYTPRAR